MKLRTTSFERVMRKDIIFFSVVLLILCHSDSIMLNDSVREEEKKGIV